ncbi:Hypothetical protein ING2D1G_0434 [Peptoniphilus sp. ING2-D1G]|nr:Hypothetical protein ING2D1G_0434 [Peptoniphilus sp. ING2-D1G]
MKEKFLKFMYGRYGTHYGLDALNKFALILSIIISLAIAFNLLPAEMRFVSYIFIFILYVRTFSRNINKRYEENQKFLEVTAPVRAVFTRLKNNATDKENKYMKCPNCGQELRVPRKKGRIRVICIRCKKEFQSRT